MNRNVVTGFLIVVALAACNAGAAGPPVATATPTTALTPNPVPTPSPTATPEGAKAPPAEIVAAFCDYKGGFTAIGEDDAALDILVAARQGDPDEWVRSAGPEMVARAKLLSEPLADIVWWGGTGTLAPRTALKSLGAWTSALEASLTDPDAYDRYALIWTTWYAYSADHHIFIWKPGTLEGSCA